MFHLTDSLSKAEHRLPTTIDIVGKLQQNHFKGINLWYVFNSSKLSVAVNSRWPGCPTVPSFLYIYLY